MVVAAAVVAVAVVIVEIIKIALCPSYTITCKLQKGMPRLKSACYNKKDSTSN